jgi:small-conductance mechanosensitive channel
MALSNIFCEPRREITESVVGITVFVLVVIGPLAIAWHVASEAVAADRDLPFLLPFIATIIGELIVVVVVFGLSLLTHAIGERVCNALARKGVELRPRRR